MSLTRGGALLTDEQKATAQSGLGIPQLFSIITSGVFDPMNYGAVGDGTTDDTAGLAAAVFALNAHGGGILKLSDKNFGTTQALPPITVPAHVLGFGFGDELGNGAISTIRSSSATARLFDFQHAGCEIEGVLLRCTAANPTDGAGVYWTQGGGGRCNKVMTYGFWINVDHENSREWSMDQSPVLAFAKYGIRVRNVAIPDGGDWSLSNFNLMTVGTRAADAHIYIESAGGGKLTNIKTNARDAARAVNAIDVNMTNGQKTVILLVSACSFENNSGSQIKVRGTTGSGWRSMQFVGNQFAQYGGANVPAIDVLAIETGQFDGLIVQGNNFGSSAGNTGPAVKLRGISQASIGPNLNNGYAELLDALGCSGVNDFDQLMDDYNAGAFAGGGTAPVTYSENVLADNPLVYWKLDESSGSSYADASGHGNLGIGHNAIGQIQAGLIGDSANSISLDRGNSAFIGSTIDPFGTDYNGGYTCECVVKLADLSVLNGLMSRGADGAVSSHLIANTDGSVQFTINSVLPGGSNYHGVDLRTPVGLLTAGSVAHIAATWLPGVGLKVFVNGALEASVAESNTVMVTPTTDKLNLGKIVTPFFMSGQIDEAAWYGTALSATRIAAHYAARNA